MISPRVWVTVLAGGIGSRFWPASTPQRPKQLLPLASERPLIVDTVDRARALVPDERIRILAGDHLVAPFQGVVDALPDSSYWIEPRARGTAPVLAWAAWKLHKLDPDAVMVSLHADHLIEPISGFVETVASAVEIATRDDLLLSIGVPPQRVETGYGHIEPGEVIESEGVGSAATGVEAATMRGNRRRCGVTTVEAIDDAGGGSCGACSGVWKSAEESPQRKPRLRARAHKVPNAMVAGISLSAAQALQPHSGQTIW